MSEYCLGQCGKLIDEGSVCDDCIKKYEIILGLEVEKQK